MQGLAEWLRVPQELVAEWHAIALLEEAMPLASSGSHSYSQMSSPATSINEVVARAFLLLHRCRNQQHALYCAQLMHALGVPALALRQLQRASSALAMPQASVTPAQRLKVCEAFEAQVVCCCSTFTS
jgi:hypothetical protein